MLLPLLCVFVGTWSLGPFTGVLVGLICGNCCQGRGSRAEVNGTGTSAAQGGLGLEATLGLETSFSCKQRLKVLFSSRKQDLLTLTLSKAGV